MNQPATKKQIQDFGNRTGVVVSHKQKNRASRRARVKTTNEHAHLIGGARIPPQYTFLSLGSRD